MLIDVTAHLMNAIDKASRLGEPLERIALAAEAGAEARESEEARREITRYRRRRRSLKAAAAIVIAIAVLIPIAIFTHAFDRIYLHRSAYATASGSHVFTLGGVRHEITRDQFSDRLKTVDPEAIRKYWVAIDGKRFPVKQAVAAGLDAQRAAFSSSQAISVLRKLGFDPQATGP